MKIKFLIFSLLLSCCFMSCSDPDTCVEVSFEENVVGTWDYEFSGAEGRVKINADGTYEDLEGEIISNGPITSRTWSIENNELEFAVQNASLQTGWISYDCDSFVLDGQGFPNFNFTRV